MSKSKNQEGLSVKKEEDFSEWYNQVCLKAGLAEYSTVKGCMVIKPLGYSIWENIQKNFNKIIKSMGVRNAYFPLFIPESFFKKEATHAEGFTPEVAWLDKEVTGGEEKLAVRPTSETIMYDSYSRWIRSHRDLPLRINQWCNVVRWETKATRLFLRSREFLWQEGHCVYATADECVKETIEYAKRYKKFIEEFLGIPILIGAKTDKEKFSGAETTYSVEAIMPDSKALQAGTSHDLGNNFAKAFGIQFEDKDKKLKYPFQNSWGISTRLIGALVMTHADDKGLVIPPKIADEKIVVVPIRFEQDKKVLVKSREIVKRLSKYNPILDERLEVTPGYKFNEWELKGVPVRIEIGPKDLEKKECILFFRDSLEKKVVKIKDLEKVVSQELIFMQKRMFEKAKKVLESKLDTAESLEELNKKIKQGKIVLVPLENSKEVEDILKDKLEGVKTLNRPFKQPNLINKKCIISGKSAAYWVYVGRSY